MPSTRRGRFSVYKGNEIGGRDSTKMQNSTKTSHQHFNTIQTVLSLSASTSKNKMPLNSSKNLNDINIVGESAESVIANTKSEATNDNNITASSSNIDLFNKPSEDSTVESLNPKASQKKEREARQERDKTPARRLKHHQHRIIDSPRRHLAVTEQKGTKNRTIGTVTIDWEQEMEAVAVTDVLADNEEEHRTSSDSIEDMCRICHGGDSLIEVGQLISACSCRGTVGRVHVKCLERWLTESGKSRCELCGTRYQMRRVHRYGVPKALLMWVLSQNAMQLLVDSLGIMLMSPLAVLAAWLSGRTLAGLMKQDSPGTPWPLASTFVLACMTLVCYYCWIVSAATRHALGWWIWYRSQYEVRLQILEIEE